MGIGKHTLPPVRVFSKYSVCLLLSAFQSILLCHTTGAEPRAKVDSLRHALAMTPSPERRIPILLECSELALQFDLANSVRFAEESLALSERKGDLSSAILSQALLARAYIRSGFLERGAEALRRNLLMSRSLNHGEGAFEALVGMASVHLSLSEHLRAHLVLDSAWAQMQRMVARKVSVPTDEALIEFHVNYGLALMGQGDLSNAGKHLDECLRLIGGAGHSRTVNEMMSNATGLWLSTSGHRDSARSVFTEAMGLSRELGDRFGLASASMAMGGMSAEEGDMASAKVLFSEAFRLAEGMGASRLAERSARSLSRVFQHLGFIDSSLYYSRTADEKRRDMDERGAVETLSSLHQSVPRERVPKLASNPDYRYYAFMSAFLLAFLGISVYRFRSVSAPTRKALYAPADSRAEEALSNDQSMGPEATGNLEVSPHATGRPGCANILENIMLDERIKRIVGCLQDCLANVDVGRRSELKKAIRDIEKSRNDNLWDALEDRLNHTYDGFTEKIRRKAPNLSQNERRLCILLRMDMNTKDISRLTGQSIRAVELGRIRLRKKLNLTNTESNLNDFLACL